MSVSLWLFLLLPCLASSASAPNWWPAEITDLAQTVIVRSIPDFIAALRNQSIATIHVDTDLLLVGDAWPPKVIHVRRNLTIRSLDIGRLQLITFANVTDKVSLDPEVHISFRNIAATGSANAYWSLISTSPSAFFWLRDSVFMPMSCSHKSKAIPAVLTHPRPPDYPGINRLSVRVFPFCFRRRCFEQTFDVGEFFIDRPPYVAGGMLPMYTKFVADTFYACHTYFTDACTELRGYAACRAEMTTRHIEEGLSFTYPQWVLEVIVALAVLSCCALLGGGWWLLCCSSVRGGSKKPTSLGHPTASGVRLAGAADNKLDRVKLQAFLASGSFGHVYQGIWQGRTVAVKVVQHGGKTTLKISREVSISMGLAAHPNIVQTFHHFMMATTEFESQRPAAQSSDSFDSWKPYASAESSGSLGDDVQQTCIVMELCDQGNLSSHLKRHGSRVGHGRSLDEDLVLDCARGVAQGMAHLHAHNICHGDLKASNVLVMSDPSASRQSVVKVSDFGLSRVLDPDSSHIHTQTVGTITHMAPELLLHNRLTCESDVYSFGILLWEMTSGESPYPTLHAGQVLHKILEGSRPSFQPHVPSDLVELACDCWGQEAVTRPTFVEVAARLQGMIRRREKRAARRREQGSKSPPLKMD